MNFLIIKIWISPLSPLFSTPSLPQGSVFAPAGVACPISRGGQQKGPLVTPQDAAAGSAPCRNIWSLPVSLDEEGAPQWLALLWVVLTILVLFRWEKMSAWNVICSFVLFFILFYLFIYLLNIKKIFFYLWLCWVFVSVRGLSLVAASGGHSSLRCAGLSLSWPLLLRSTGSRCAGSVVVAHGPSSSAACGIFPDQGSNPCPLHWQADSQPLCHQGSPNFTSFLAIFPFWNWRTSES